MVAHSGGHFAHYRGVTLVPADSGLGNVATRFGIDRDRHSRFTRSSRPDDRLAAKDGHSGDCDVAYDACSITRSLIRLSEAGAAFVVHRLGDRWCLLNMSHGLTNQDDL